jgi:large subunit ribosomal protein L10
MSRRVKEMLIEDLGVRLKGVKDILVVDASKLDGVTANKLRLSMRKKKISALGIRNKLGRVALKNVGVTSLDPLLEGPSTLVWGGEDIVALSKDIAKWAKEIEPLQIKGGTTEGTTLSKETVEELAKSPGRKELIGQIAAAMMSPGAQLAGVLLGPGRELASQIEKISEKSEQEESAAEAPAAT